MLRKNSLLEIRSSLQHTIGPITPPTLISEIMSTVPWCKGSIHPWTSPTCRRRRLVVSGRRKMEMRPQIFFLRKPLDTGGSDEKIETAQPSPTFPHDEDDDYNWNRLKVKHFCSCTRQKNSRNYLRGNISFCAFMLAVRKDTTCSW